MRSQTASSDRAHLSLKAELKEEGGHSVGKAESQRGSQREKKAREEKPSVQRKKTRCRQ